MTIWLDAQLPPSVAPWVESTFGVECRAVRDLGLRDAKDPLIFIMARAAGAVVMTKDKDFVDLHRRLGPPPVVLWVTCGNTTNARLRAVLASVLPEALRLIGAGETLVEIGDAAQGGTTPG